MLSYFLTGYKADTIRLIYDAVYYSLGIFGISLALLLFSRKLLALHYDLRKVRKYILVLLFIFPLGFFGSRAVEMFYHHPSRWSLNYFMHTVVSGSVHTFHGALIAGTLFAAISGVIMKFRLRHVLDSMFLYVPLAHAIARIGCLMVGCCWGKVLYLSFFGRDYILSHPVPFYEMCVNALIFTVLWFLYKVIYGKEKSGEITVFNGLVFSLYLIFYGTARFLLENMRGENEVLMGLTQAQAVMAFFIIAGLSVAVNIMYRFYRYKND